MMPRGLCRATFLSIGFVSALAGVGGSARADGLPRPGDFSAKWISVPDSFEGRRRIDVQIDPVEQAAALALPSGYGVFTPLEDEASPGPQAATTETLPYSWFWNEISPSLEHSAPDSLEAAEVLITSPSRDGAIAIPAMQNLQIVAEKYGRDILGATVGTRVSPAFVLAVIGVESSGRSDAVSSAGASGLMQLMPATAERFGVTDRSDPVQNIKGGVAYLDWLMKEFNYDPVMVLAAYNAGENAVRRNGGVPEYAETRGYVPKVVAAWTVARGLCSTPPELATDPCVFYVNLAGNDG